jgi:hypothetical protein
VGQIFSNANSALIDPQTQQPTFMGSPSQVLSRANQALAQTTIPDVSGRQIEPASSQNLPFIGTPTAQQAAQYGAMPGGANALSPGLSKLGKLATFLTSGVQGALGGRAAQEEMIAASGGRRAGGIGTGFTAGYQLPFLRAMQAEQVQRGQAETQIAQQQARLYPQLATLGAQKTLSETQKNVAEAGKAGAEASAIPTKQALEQAQTEAAHYKDDPNLGLIDLRNGQPLSNAASAPLTQDEATILGKQAGERVPLKLKNTTNEIMNRGIRTVQANGRSLLVDNQGNTIKDIGTATPVVVMNNQLGAAGNPNSPEFQSTVDAVGQGKIDLAELPYEAPCWAEHTKGLSSISYPCKKGRVPIRSPLLAKSIHFSCLLGHGSSQSSCCTVCRDFSSVKWTT